MTKQLINTLQTYFKYAQNSRKLRRKLKKKMPIAYFILLRINFSRWVKPHFEFFGKHTGGYSTHLTMQLPETKITLAQGNDDGNFPFSAQYFQCIPYGQESGLAVGMVE